MMDEKLLSLDISEWMSWASGRVLDWVSNTPKDALAANLKDWEDHEVSRLILLKRTAALESTNNTLLEALAGVNGVLAVWVLDPSKSPHTLVACIQAITEPAIRQAKEK